MYSAGTMDVLRDRGKVPTIPPPMDSTFPRDSFFGGHATGATRETKKGQLSKEGMIVAPNFFDILFDHKRLGR